MEYLTTWLITQVTAEEQSIKLERLIEHGLKTTPVGKKVRRTRSI